VKHEREVDTSYLHKPHILGGKLLSLHHVAEGDGVEGATGSGSGKASPPILVVFRSVWCVRVFSPPPCEFARGGCWGSMQIIKILFPTQPRIAQRSIY
jgi:hypothetical protein